MKNIFLLFSILFSCTLLSCQDEIDRENRTGTDHIKLSYTIPQAASVITRSDVAIVNGEDKINTFYILFFENDSEGAGQFIAAIDVMEGNQGSLSGSGILDIDLSKVSGLSGRNAYKMLACANIEAYIPAIENLAGLEAFCRNRSENEVTRSLRLQVTEGIPGIHDEDYQPIAAGNLPMSAAIVKEAGQQQVSVNLVRAVSRFDVINQASGYELESVSLWNVATSSLLWEQAGTHFSGGHTSRYYSVQATGNRITGGLYSFENFVDQPEPGDTETTTLVIGMKNQSTGLTEYFRTNIYALNQSQKLKRNNVYTTTIREVLGSGYFTEREAYESNRELLSSDINGWATELGDNVVYDEDNILAMPASIISLAMAGDTRIYNIFTDGEGLLELSTEDIPSEVNVRLEGNKLHIDAPKSSLGWEGVLTFTIGRLTASMLIGQAEHINHYLYLGYDVEGLPALGYEAGSISPEIDVTSSGKWVAKIYGSDYLTFDPSASQEITGEAGTSFAVRTTAENTSSNSRYCFAVVSLVDVPEIRRILVLEQGTKPVEYIRFNPGTSVKVVNSRSIPLKLESNVEWEVTFECAANYNNETIIFKESGRNTISGSDDQTITIIFPNKINQSATVVLLTAKAKHDPTIKATQTFMWWGTGSGDPDPEPTPEPARPRLFVSNGTGIGNLASPTSDGYKHYVYGLGQNMRNTAKFGKNGSLASTGKDPFEYTGSLNATTIADAQIIQLVSNPNATLFNQIYKRMQEDPTVFLMITSRDPAVINNILAQFNSKTNTRYGSAVDIANSPSNVRPLNTDNNTLLMQDILNRPGGVVNASQISLQSSVGQKGAALPPSAYPTTFVPIIMANRNNDYCVFGIDPVHRLIIMTDPGVFGAAPAYTAYPSYKNYLTAGSANSIFLDNLTAWIINATGKDGFLSQYQR